MKHRFLIFFCLAAYVFFTAHPSSCNTEDLETRRMQYQNDVAAVTERFEGMIPPEACDADGLPMKEHPAYKKVKAQYDAAIIDVQKSYEKYNLERIQQHNEVIKEIPPELAKKIKSTGRDPASINSDIDLSADFDAANAYSKAMGKKPGNNVIPKGDRFVITGKQDTTVWINKRPGSDPVGSSSLEAEIAHKAAVDSDAYLSIGDNTSKKVELLDHTRKFVDAKSTGDIRVQAKAVNKIIKSSGVAPSDAGIAGQSEKIYNGATAEQAGIVDFGDPPEVKKQKINNFTKRGEKTIVDINKNVDGKSVQEYNDLDKQINDAVKAGDKNKAVKLKETKIINKLKENGSLKAIAESDPEFGGKLTGNEVTKVTNTDGSVVYKDSAGKTISKSELVNRVGNNVYKDLKSTFKSMVNPAEPVISYVKTPTSVKAGAGAVLALLVFDKIYRDLKKEEKPWESSIETAGKALVYATGIPGAIGIGEAAAQKAVKEYQDCINQGRKDCSKAMTVLKANLYAVNDANTAFWTGIADIPNLVINTPLRWETDSAEETAKEMEKRVEEYRPIGALRKLALELSRLAGEADTQLRSFVPLDEQAWNLQKQVSSISSSQLQLDGSIKKLKNLCTSAKEINKKSAAVKNLAEIYANITKRLTAVKQYAQQTCSASNQTIKAFSEGKIDEKGLESYKANIKSTYLDQAETQYAYAQQEMTSLKGTAGEKTDLATQAVNAQKEFTKYMNFIQAVSKGAAKLTDDYVKKIVQLNATVTEFNNALARFRTGVKYFYNEKDVKEQQEILEIARQVDALKIDIKSAVEHEGKIKDFYRFTVDVTKLAQLKPEPCPEMDLLISRSGGDDRSVPAFEEAGKMIAEGRNCYANLKSASQVKAEVSIRVSPASAEVFVGDTLTFVASLTPETKGAQNYFRWTVNNQESGNKSSSQPLKIGCKGSHTVRVEAFRAVSGAAQKIGEATYSLIAKEKEQVKAKASIYISGPGKIKMGQSGTYTGMISETNVSESVLYFKWLIDEKETGSGKTISFNGSTPGVHAVGAELWMRGNPDTRLAQIGYAVVVEGQPAPQKDKEIKKNQYEECISSEKKYYENAVNWFPKIRNKDSYPHYSCQPMGSTQEYPPKQCCDTYYATRNQPGRSDAWYVLQECGWKVETKKRKETFDKKAEACRKKYPDAKP
ncbi:MAG: hypothetical protein NTX75_06690 [Proteobacteria bacterium]|nr:hypothetical protein [Pseudomonadota bacterium]